MSFNESQVSSALLDEITPVILTLNEAQNLSRNLHLLRHFKQIVAVDSGSTDETFANCARYLCTASHDYTLQSHLFIVSPITLCADSGVTADVFLGPRVEIGEGSVLAARSTVVRDVPPWMVGRQHGSIHQKTRA